VDAARARWRIRGKRSEAKREKGVQGQGHGGDRGAGERMRPEALPLPAGGYGTNGSRAVWRTSPPARCCGPAPIQVPSAACGPGASVPLSLQTLPLSFATPFPDATSLAFPHSPLQVAGPGVEPRAQCAAPPHTPRLEPTECGARRTRVTPTGALMASPTPLLPRRWLPATPTQ